MQRKLDKDRYNDKVQRPTTSRHVPVRILSKKMAYNIQNEPSRNEGLETTAHQESIDKNNETIWQKKRKKVGPRLVKVLATAGPAISNSESIDKSNETIEPGTSSSQLVVKDEPCSNEELHPALPDSSNHNVSLTPSSRESIDKNYETIWHETSSSLPVVKDEPSLFDELADTVPASSDHSDKLIPGNTDPAPNPEKPRMENLSDRNNERNRIELESSVVKDEPSVIKESASIFSTRSDHSDNFTHGNAGQLTPALERRPHRQTGLTKPRTSSNSAINLDHLYQPEGVMKELTSTFPGPSDHGNYVTLSNNENLSEQNNVRNGTEHVNSVVVKDEPNLMEELTTAFPSSSNYNDSLIPSDTENLSEQNNVRNGTEHVNSVLVKDEPNLMEELTTAFPSSSNYNDSLIPPNTGSAAPSLKPKRSRKQNFSDLNIKSTQPQTSSSLPVVKEEPSLIDELAANIPGPSNYRISPSNNANSTDSDDEIRIFTEPPAPKRPRSRNRLGIYDFKMTSSSEDEFRILVPPNNDHKRKRYLTTEERHLIVSYSEAGHSSTEIAALLKCTPYHDSTNLESNTNSEVAENASIPVPKDLTEFSHSIANTALDTAQNPGENSITVDGFTKEVTEESLKEFYSQFGQVVGCTIGTDPETGRQSATVEFSSKEAVNRLNNRFFLNSRSNKERMPTSRTSPEGMFDGELVDVAGEPKSNRSQSIAVDKEPDQAQTRLKSFLESDEPKAVKSSSIAESKASNPTKSSNKLDFRRYHIWACGFSENVTEDMLREFYSRFGEVVSCSVRKQRNGEMSAVVAFSSKKAMNRALQSVQHRINNERVFVTVWTGPHELELRLLNLSPKTTEESLRKFYSKFGKLTRCVVNKAPRPSYVIFASHDDLDRALDAQPHVIDGSEVFLKYASGELDLIIKNVPEGITEESLHTHFSQYGQLRQCELLKTSDGNKHGYVSFSAIDEVNRAIEDRPHIIDKKILRTEFLNKSCSFSLFVDSLPKNATLESLFNAFSKFGKIVYLELHNDGGMNQRGPYGFVSYGTKQEADNALNTRPYKVDGSIVYVRIASQKHDEYNKKKLILNLNLSI